MPSLSQAHLQRSYRPVLWGFVVLVLLSLTGTILLGQSSATITVTPKLIPANTSFSLVVGPDADPSTGLTGTVSTSVQKATVTAAASSQGTDIPAHASGQITIHNTTSGAQALSQGTRLASGAGVIVRTANRVDVPAKGSVNVTVTADPTGADGNLAPGRLTIVALRAANQPFIYGEVVTALTGGTVKSSGTLALNDLTKASDEAQAKIKVQAGADQPGHLHLFTPQSVTTVPPATTPSTTYSVTVTMNVVDITFTADKLTQRMKQELTATLADDQQLVKLSQPVITTGDQPTATSIALSVQAQGEAQVTSVNQIFQSKNFLGLDQAAIEKKLLGSPTVKAVAVRFAPFWRSSAPTQASHITVRVAGEKSL